MGLLGGSWGSYKWGYKFLTWVISIVTLLITPLITTHEPPSNAVSMGLSPPPPKTSGMRFRV